MKLRTARPKLAPHSAPRSKFIPAPVVRPKWRPDAIRGNRHERGYGTAWDKLRPLILDRDEGLCQPCLKQGRIRPARQVDHITPKARGGTDEPENLQSICIECHEMKTAEERRGADQSN